MKNKINNCRYELIYIANENITDLKQIEKKIIDLLELTKYESKDLGLKKIAYPIKKETKGHYVQLNFVCSRNKIPLLKEKIRWFPEILRSLIVNLDEEKYFRHPKRPKYTPYNRKENKEEKENKPPIDVDALEKKFINKKIIIKEDDKNSKK